MYTLQEGDVIAYRLIELTASWTPELSSFRVHINYQVCFWITLLKKIASEVQYELHLCPCRLGKYLGMMLNQTGFGWNQF